MTTETTTTNDKALIDALLASDEWEVFDPAALMDEVEAAPAPVVPTEKMVTDKQVQFIASLVKDRDIADVTRSVDEVREAVMARTFTARQASALIDVLLAQPRVTAPATDVPEGMHVLDGKIYKVQVAKNGSGNKYAKELAEDEITGKWSFVYAPGAIRRLSTATVMDAEAAAEFGALYGICCACGRDLTDERSIAAGYGPVCADNNGWAWG